MDIGSRTMYPPPLRKHSRGPKSQVKTAVQRPTPCLDKAMHARDTRDSKRVGEPSDGDGRAANGEEHFINSGIVLNLLPIPHVLQMDAVVPMKGGTKNMCRHMFPSAPNVRDSHAGNKIVSCG